MAALGLLACSEVQETATAPAEEAPALPETIPHGSGYATYLSHSQEDCNGNERLTSYSFESGPASRSLFL